MRQAWAWKSSRGWMGAVVEDRRVLRKLVLPRRSRAAALAELEIAAAREGAPAGLAASVERYFRTGVFRTALAADPDGGTPFQREVWRETMRIPAGRTRTYGWLARRLGIPGGARAVGRAMGANPLPILVP